MSSVPSGVVSSDSLKAAIACLDLSLESELTLFRRAQSQAREALLVLPVPEIDQEAAESAELSFLADDSAPTETTFPASDNQPSAPSIAEPEGLTSGIVPLSEPEEDLETLPEPYTAELTAEPEAFEQFLDPSIEDYLESSEALLKHLDEPVDEPAKERPMVAPPIESPKKNWLTAAGIVLIGLGMLVLAGFFTVWATRWLAPQKPSGTPTPQTSTLPQSTVPQSTQGSGAAANPPLGQGGADEPAIKGSPSPTASPAPLSANYIVLMDYRGLESLEAARAVVPDAFIADIDGKQHIQMGYLETAQQAQQVVNELKQRGFSATIQGLN